MKPTVTKADIYYKPVKQYFRNAGACTHANVFLISTHTLINTHAYFPDVYPVSLFCPPHFRYGPSGKDLHAPKCCFSPHYCQRYPPVTDDGLHVGQCSGFSPQPLTHSNSKPSLPSLLHLPGGALLREYHAGPFRSFLLTFTGQLFYRRCTEGGM